MTSSLDGLNVRLLREDDLPAVVDLLQLAFDGWPAVPASAAPIDHLRWKLGDGRPGDVYHHVAELEGRIVAFQMNLAWRMKIRDREMRLMRGWDAVVHPDYQGKGVMAIFRSAMLKDLSPVSDMFVSPTGHAAIARLYEREDRRAFGRRWMVYMRPLTLAAARSVFKLRPRRKLRKTGESFAAFLRWVAIEGRGRAVKPQSLYSIRTVERFDERIDAFCEEASTVFDAVNVRNAELLNWRYADRRAGNFTIRVATEGERIVGYAALRIANGIAHVADIMALPSRDDVILALGRDAARQLHGQADTIECWLFENSPYVAALRQAGFLGVRKRAQPTYEAVAASHDELAFMADKSTQIHMPLGDMDWV